MGNGGYHGGSTVIGFGMRWSDAHDFPAPESHPTGAKPKNKKKKKARPKAKGEIHCAELSKCPASLSL